MRFPWQSAPVKENQEYYDEFSDWYEQARHAGYHALLDQLQTELVRPHCAGKTVLDAGCGTGLILREIRHVASSAIGVDLSAGMLGRAKQRQLPVAQASVQSLPFADGTFDVVFSFKVLAHVEQIEAVVAELARVTRPGGRLFLEFYNPLSLRYLAKRIHPAHISDQTTEQQVFTRWDTPRDVRQLLPPQLELLELHGVRVLTPFAQLHRVPLLGRLLSAGERWAVGSPLRHLGGFLVAECLRLP